MNELLRWVESQETGSSATSTYKLMMKARESHCGAISPVVYKITHYSLITCRKRDGVVLHPPAVAEVGTPAIFFLSSQSVASPGWFRYATYSQT